jgi:hypothetical protein
MSVGKMSFTKMPLNVFGKNVYWPIVFVKNVRWCNGLKNVHQLNVHQLNAFPKMSLSQMSFKKMSVGLMYLEKVFFGQMFFRRMSVGQLSVKTIHQPVVL